MPNTKLLDPLRDGAGLAETRRHEALLKAGALQNAIFNSANFSSIATDANGVIQIFNVGAERMLGYSAAEVMNTITPANISDPLEVIARAEALSAEFSTPIAPGFEALVFKASRSIEDIYELTYIRKDGSRFPAVVSVTALRDAQKAIIGYLLIGTDNTARKQAEEALLKAGALQTAIFNSTNFSSIATDANGVIQIFNVGAERMLGYTAAEVTNKITPADISDPQELIVRARALSLELATEIKPGFEALVFKASRGIEDIYELTYIRKDGSRFPAVVSVTALRDAREAIIGYLLIGTDNTAREQSSQYARSLLEASLDPLVTISPEGKITDVNQGSVKVTGMAREKLIGTDFSDYFTEPEKARLGYQQVFADGFVTDYPLTIRHHDGRLTDVLYNASIYRDVRGNVLGVFAAARDITARKQAEAALLKAGTLQRAIFDSANFSSIATDAKGVIQIFNVGAEHMLGYTADEVMDKITPADISDPQEVVARARALSVELGTTIAPGFEALVFKASRGIEDIYELTYIRKDGSRFPAVVSVTALRDVEGTIIGYLLIGTDNTARKQAEEARQQMNAELTRAKMVAEKANLAKSEFLSSMSHELRSPLNAILGFAQLIDTGSPLPTPNQKESVDQILQAGWYLLELINEILDLSLIESGKLSLSLECISLDEVLNTCQAMIEPQAQKGGIRVKFSGDTGLYFVMADRTRVKQIFINLLSNAIKYNRLGGMVEVTCTRVAAERTRISFRDTGDGLSSDKLAQLFQPFNRLGQESGSEEGTGIGLVVCKRLAELMGGAIGAESEVGVGSVFWVEFSATSPEESFVETLAPEVTTTALLDCAPHRYTVLYVEDNPANLMLIERLMARRGDVRLLSAREGNQGIAMARELRPDLILMDINLPGISGITAMQILAADPATAAIPVIALSANAMPRDIEKGMEAGFVSYLTKPIKVDAFIETLDLALMHSAASKKLKELS